MAEVVDIPMWSRGTVQLWDTQLVTIGARFRLGLRLQAGEGSMSVNVPTESAIGIVVPLNNCTVPPDSVTEAAMEFVEFAERPELQFENSPAFRPFSCNEKGRFPNRAELCPCTWHEQSGRSPGSCPRVLPWVPVPCVEW